MKKIIVILALLTIGLSTQAGVVIKDTTTGIQYLPIQAVTVVDKKACKMTCRVIGDNLDDVATFYFELLDKNNIAIYSGNVTITGDDYDSYNANDNESAYLIVALKKGFTVKQP